MSECYIGPSWRKSFSEDSTMAGPLKINPKPLDIFIVAEQFRAAGKLAAIIPQNLRYPFAQDLPPLHSASMACLAFALELYFKCLIRMGNKPYDTGHDLAKLFKKIGRPTQAKIKSYFRANKARITDYVTRMYQGAGRPVPKVDFDFVLNSSKDAFIDFRYLFESGAAADTGWLAGSILDGARFVILERRPNWGNATQLSPWAEVSFPPNTQIR